MSFEWVRRPEDRKPNEQRQIDAVRADSDELATAFGLADEFADLLRKRPSGTLSDWLMKGEASSCPEIRRFAEGILRDGAVEQRPRRMLCQPPEDDQAADVRSNGVSVADGESRQRRVIGVCFNAYAGRRAVARSSKVRENHFPLGIRIIDISIL